MHIILRSFMQQNIHTHTEKRSFASLSSPLPFLCWCYAHIYLLPKGYCLIQHMCGLCVIFECLIFTLFLSPPSSIHRIDTHSKRYTTQGVVSNKQLVCSGFCRKAGGLVSAISIHLLVTLFWLLLFKMLIWKISLFGVFACVLPYSLHKCTDIFYNYFVMFVSNWLLGSRLNCKSKNYLIICFPLK